APTAATTRAASLTSGPGLSRAFTSVLLSDVGPVRAWNGGLFFRACGPRVAAPIPRRRPTRRPSRLRPNVSCSSGYYEGGRLLLPKSLPGRLTEGCQPSIPYSRSVAPLDVPVTHLIFCSYIREKPFDADSGSIQSFSLWWHFARVGCTDVRARG